MGRYNGSFRFRNAGVPSVDEETGFYDPSGSSDWQDGCECQIDRSVPAKQIIGVDGQTYSYAFDVFIPICFRRDIEVGTEIELTGEFGEVDAFIVKGVDVFNRRYIELWG